MDEGSFTVKAIEDRAGSEMKIPDRPSPSEKIDQVVCNGKASLVTTAMTMTRMTIKLTHDLRNETLRVSKEHEHEFLSSLPQQ